MEENRKEKKNWGLMVIIILLLLICFCLGGFIFLNKEKIFFEKETTSTESTTNGKKENDKETEVVSEKEAATFMRKIEKFNMYFSKKYPIEDVNKISNDDVLKMGEILVVGDLFTSDGVKGFSGEKLKDEIISYFGADYPLELKDISCHAGDGVLYQYNASNDEYLMVGQHGHDGPGFSRNKAYFQEGIYDKTTGAYIIKVKVLSAVGCGGTCGPSDSFYDAFNFNKAIYNTQDDLEYDVVYQEVSDRLSTVTYIFIKNSDGGYGLKSVKLG